MPGGGIGVLYPSARDVRVEEPREMKHCEFGCGRMFWRPVPKMAKDGQRHCVDCAKLTMKARELQYEAAHRREVRARHGVM